MTEKEAKMKMQAKLFDMGHAPKERVVNRVFNQVGAEGEATEERLHEVLADENTHDAIQELYS
ncbi:MAG TPA: hypothetical protein VG245_09935 [Candidatus Dormibacteraeota bacterium]|jgi:hypothetical protein|nr:hypothetical protein [Candidatus Dormibacteraeota bacterium]